MVTKAFDFAWNLGKMPVYHGTTREAWDRIQNEGIRHDIPEDKRVGGEEGGAVPPQQWDNSREDILEALSHTYPEIAEQLYERWFGGRDWTFGFHAPADDPEEMAEAKRQAAGWGDVVLEIDDDLDWVNENLMNSKIAPQVGEMDGWDFNQVRVRGPIPSENIRFAGESRDLWPERFGGWDDIYDN